MGKIIAIHICLLILWDNLSQNANQERAVVSCVYPGFLEEQTPSKFPSPQLSHRLWLFKSTWKLFHWIPHGVKHDTCWPSHHHNAKFKLYIQEKTTQHALWEAYCDILHRYSQSLCYATKVHQGGDDGLAMSCIYPSLHLVPGCTGKSLRGGILSFTWSSPLASAKPLILWFGLNTCPCKAEKNE